MTWLTNSRIIAIFAVVFLHTAASVVVGNIAGSEDWWIGNLYDSIVRWCVPVFVMISGALLLDPSKDEDLKTFYRKRVSRVLVPILFWSAFFLLWGVAKGMIKGHPLSLMDLANRILSGKPYAHMWFLYMIITLYVFAPFLKIIIKYSARNEIYALVFSTFAITAINAINMNLFSGNSKVFLNWFLSYIPYFILGHLIRTDDRNHSKPLLWLTFITSTFLTAIGCYFELLNKDTNIGIYFYDYLSITVIPMSASIMYLLKLWKNPIGSENFSRILASLTLGIYLIHPIVLEIIGYIGYGPLSFNPTVSIPITAIITYSASLVLALLIYRLPYFKYVI